jgi:hypothetical protein
MNAKRIIFVIVLGLLAFSLGASPAAAQATRVNYEGQECTTSSWGVPERSWISEDGIMHMRGIALSNQINSDSPYMTGINSLKMNVDLDPTTGEGHAYGTFTLSPTAIDGDWVGHWSTHVSPAGISGRAVGQGTGALTGMKVVNHMLSSDPNSPCNNDFGYVLMP